MAIEIVDECKITMEHDGKELVLGVIIYSDDYGK